MLPTCACGRLRVFFFCFFFVLSIIRKSCRRDLVEPLPSAAFLPQRLLKGETRLSRKFVAVGCLYHLSHPTWLSTTPHHQQQQHHNPAEQCGLWPHFRLAGGGVLTAHNGALFTCSEGPGPGLQTTLSTQWALLLFLFFLFLFFFFFSPSRRCLSLSGPRRSLPPALGTRGREGWSERWRR